MKNIHILPTDKPSRLLYFGTSKELTLQVNPATFRTFERSTQHVYITSDEEIKEGDYMYDIDGDVGKAIGSDMKEFEGNKKIILTTDQDLIKDGVQAIDDEFLEWFVKNPSCEEVSVGIWSNLAKDGYLYHIIIPKEEQKQHLIDIMRGDEELELYEEPKQIKCYCGHTTYCDCGPLEEPKQETLEALAKEFYSNENQLIERIAFKRGYTECKERMYTEEDLRTAYAISKNANNFNEWFEQLKKK